MKHYFMVGERSWMFSTHPQCVAYFYVEEVMKKLEFYWMMFQRCAADDNDFDFHYSLCGEDMYVESTEFTAFANANLANEYVRDAVAEIRAFEPRC